MSTKSGNKRLIDAQDYANLYRVSPLSLDDFKGFALYQNNPCRIGPVGPSPSVAWPLGPFTEDLSCYQGIRLMASDTSGLNKLVAGIKGALRIGVVRT